LVARGEITLKKVGRKSVVEYAQVAEWARRLPSVVKKDGAA
jgi:hypothetical protein